MKMLGSSLKTFILSSLLLVAAEAQSLPDRVAPRVQLNSKIQSQLADDDGFQDSVIGVRRYLENEMGSIKEAAQFGDVEIPVQSLRQRLAVSKNGPRILVEYQAKLNAAVREGKAASEKGLLLLMQKAPELVSPNMLSKYSQSCKSTAVKNSKSQFCEKSRESLTQVSLEKSEVLQRDICGAAEDFSARMPPIRNQTDLGWCFAFTTADLLSYEMKQDISPASVAQAYYKNPNNTRGDKRLRLLSQLGSGLYEGGWVHEALAESKRVRVCTEKDLPSEFMDSDADSESRAPLKRTYQEIEYMAWKMKQAGFVTSDLACDMNPNGLIAAAFPHVPQESGLDVLLQVRVQDVNAVLGRKNCEGKLQTVPKKLKIYEQKYPEELSGKIFRDLAKAVGQGHPVALYMNADALDESRHESFVNTKANHAVTVVGKRWNTETSSCEFRVRNSWGISEKVEWFPASALIPATRGLTYLEN